MTLSSIRAWCVRPNLISCCCLRVGRERRRRWLAAAARRPVSRPCETERTGASGFATHYESMGCGVLPGSVQDVTGLIRTPPFMSRFHGAGFHICYRLEKWRGVWGEPFALRFRVAGVGE